MATISNPNYNPNDPKSQRFIFDKPQVINQQTGQMSNAITTNDLTPVSPIIIPPKQPVTGGNTAITPIPNLPEMPKTGEIITPTPAPQDTKQDFWSKLGSKFGISSIPEIPKPASVQEGYQTAYDKAGIDALEKTKLDKELAVSTAQAELQGIQAQVQGVIDRREADLLRLQKESEGRGITAGGLAPNESAIKRNAAIEALPLQAMALAAQAKVAGLQGQAQYAQSALANAQTKLDNAFKLKQADIENDYNYKKDVFDKVFQFATEEQKNELKKAETEATRKYEAEKTLEENKYKLATQAKDSGQGDLIAEIDGITTTAELYNVMSKIKPSTIEQQMKIEQLKKLQQENMKQDGVLTGNATKDAQTIMEGNSPLKLGDLSTKDNYRAKVAAELTKLKDTAVKTGDIYGIIKASAGGKEVSDTFLQNFEKGLNVINQIGDLQTAITNEVTGPILGIIRSANPYDVKAQEIKARLQAIVPNLARGVYGEVGVLTDNDIALYSRTLPNLKSPQELSDALLGMAVKSVQRSLENKIKTQAGFGRDVSGIENVYRGVKDLADKIIAPLEAQQTKSELDNLNISSPKASVTTSEFFKNAPTQ